MVDRKSPGFRFVNRVYEEFEARQVFGVQQRMFTLLGE
jgi:hypothetical protein